MAAPREARTLVEVIHSYLSSRGADKPVSTAFAIRAIRAVLPTCEHSDGELTDLIAVEAVRRGSSIVFDPRAADLGRYFEIEERRRTNVA